MRDMPELKVTELSIDKLVPYAGNAKEHPQAQIDQIKKSIIDYGNCDPIAIWHNENGDPEIVEGHGRLIALKQLGIKSAPTISLDHLTNQQRRAYCHIHNQTTLNSGFDIDALMADMADIDIDLEEYGFAFAAPEDIVDSDNEDEIPSSAEPRAKSGDVWRLGKHTLICGDATSAESLELLKTYGEGSARCMITDPPYNVAYQGKTGAKLTIQNDNFSTEEDFTEFLFKAFKCANDYLEAGSSFYIWHASSQALSFLIAAQKAELDIRQQLIWNKSSMILGRQDYHWKHEPCLYGWKRGARHNWYSDRCQTTVLEFDKPSTNDLHPTMKPVALIKYLITNSSKKGESVLDMFLGSGSTLIACEETGRICQGIELDPKYADVILQRWENLTGLEAKNIFRKE